MANYNPFATFPDTDEERDVLSVKRSIRSLAAVLTLLAVLSSAAAAAVGEQPVANSTISSRTGYSDQWFGQELVQLWAYDAGSAVFSPPVTDGTAIYSGSDGGRFFALDPATGTAIWTYEAGSAIKDPAFIDDGRVYFTTLRGEVIALSTAGGFIWSATMPERVDTGVVVTAGMVIVPCSDGVVRVLSASDGSEVWRYTVGLGVRLLSTPAVAGGTVLVEADGVIIALDPTTRAELWRAELSGEFRHWPVVLADRVVAAGSGDAQGGLRLLNAGTGERIRSYVYPGDNHWAAPGIDPANEYIYAGLEGGVFAFDAGLSKIGSWDRQPQATVGPKRYVMWQPLILRDMVVFPGHLEISTPDALFFFTRDGRLGFLGKTLLPEKLAAPPLVKDSVLYYGSTAGHLLAMAPVRVKVNGTLVDFKLKQPLRRQTGRIIVPARAVVEAAGGTVDWDEARQAVTARLGAHTVEMTIDSSTILVDGQPVTIDEPARIINDSTMLPIRAVIEGLGGQVAWDEQARTVIISLISGQ